MIKAYLAWNNAAVEDYQTIVFAENSREAKKIAFSSETCEDAEWINVRVKRNPKADSLYKGHDEIDWYDQDTRLALVRDLNWSCTDVSSLCEGCKAKDYCLWFDLDP